MRRIRPTPARKAPSRIPTILLEGDQPTTVSISGPGERYALGPTPPQPHADTAEGELPEGYGTERLFITARDPHWLYAHWDLNREQRQRYNDLSAEGHLVLRTYIDDFSGERISEVHVHPESHSWFVHVGRGGTKYVAELGYFDQSGAWHRIAASAATLTPPDRVSDDETAHFATIPIQVRFEELLEVVKAVVSENVPLVEAIQQLREEGFRDLPATPPEAPKAWTRKQAAALSRVVSLDELRRAWIGSLEITELLRRHLPEAITSPAPGLKAEVGQRGGEWGSISSPFGPEEGRRGFWFNVNAELVVYGATEPDAEVMIGERRIKLRPDGTFTFRFALPDGEFELPAHATAADRSETRTAHLRFGRKTAYRGEVGQHAQEASLKPPSPANVA
ncbi:MAG: DUF4912 domain-containing protein [Verrucomicrobiota bacterium]